MSLQLLLSYCVSALALLAVSILSRVSVVLVPVYTCFCILWYCWWLYLLSLLHRMFCSGLSVCLFSVALFCLYCACMFLLFANQSGSCAFLRCLRFLRNSFPSSVCIWHDLTSTLPCTIAFVQRPECGCLNLTVYALVKVCQEARLLCCSTAVFVSCLSACFNICAYPRCQQHFC